MGGIAGGAIHRGRFAHLDIQAGFCGGDYGDRTTHVGWKQDQCTQRALPGLLSMAAYGFLIGLYSSLMGVRGGSVSTVILMRYGRSIHVAVGTSAGVGVIISIAGTVGYVLAGLPQQPLLPAFSIGFVSLIGVLLIAPITSATAPFGARLAHKLPKRRLEIALGLYLLAVSLRFAFSLR